MMEEAAVVGVSTDKKIAKISLIGVPDHPGVAARLFQDLADHEINIRLKDDKRYPYIKINWQDAYPKVETTRRIVNDGSRYFGPYVAMWAVQNTLQTLRKVFPYLTCDRDITGNDPRPCLFLQTCGVQPAHPAAAIDDETSAVQAAPCASRWWP